MRHRGVFKSHNSKGKGRHAEHITVPILHPTNLNLDG